jgi:hypothetical protein
MINRNPNNISPPSHHYRKFCKEFYTQKMNANKTTRGWDVLNLRGRKDKKSESTIDLAAHTQILKQQKQLNGRTHHIPININP